MKKLDLVSFNWFLAHCVLVGVCLVGVYACDQTPPPPPKHVVYKVVDKAFIPGQRGSSVGMSMKGHLVFSDTSTRDTFKLLLMPIKGPQEPLTDEVTANQYAPVKPGDCVEYLETDWGRSFNRDLGVCP